MAFRNTVVICLILLVLSASVATCGAADLGPLAKYLTDDVVAVGYLDLTKFDPMAAVDEFAKLGVANDAEVVLARKQAQQVQAFYAELTKLGGQRALVLFRTADIQDGGPMWLVEVADDGDAGDVLELLTTWRDVARGAIGSPQSNGPTLPVPGQLAIDGRVIIGDTASRIARIEKQRGVEALPPNVLAALDSLLKADSGIVAFGDADSRRVLREMFPRLPDPFANIDGKFLADGVSWVGVTIKLPPTPTIGVTIEAANPEATLQLQTAANTALTMLKGLAMGAAASGQAEAAAALPALALLKPKLVGTRISMTIGDDAESAAAFRSVLAPALKSSRESAWRSTRINRLKQIALGMLNFESAKGTYPPRAILSADGKRLLSWRVAILPYCEQQELYAQFHLDEPWDSEHNRALLSKMPELYGDPASPDLAAAGRTTYLVPVGDGMIFNGPEGTKIRDIKDGTSNTVLVVEVTPDQAVEWTKPADWEVDLGDPLKGVRRGPGERRGDVFAAAFCDGSVRMLSNAIDASVLKSLLTIAGKETIPADGIK
jgi:hypothetical protein